MPENLPETARLLAIMARLRAPNGGCPWDLEQDFSTIAPYTIEEAYEVADAIERADMPGLCEELGDLLLQVVFHAQMAAEAGHFAFEDVARAINEKMIHRHPHVFGEADIRDAEAQTANWEAIKAEERAKKTKDTSILADIPQALPALMRAEKLQKRAARVGFDWPEARGIIEKIREELAECEEVLADKEALTEEIGDLLFAVANLARFQGIDPEDALRSANRKFTRRFQHIETTLGNQLKDAPIEEMERLWNEAKTKEKI